MKIKGHFRTFSRFIWFWIDILGGPVISVIFLIVTIYFNIDACWLKILAGTFIILSLIASIIKLIRENNLIRNDFSIVKIEILDENDNYRSPYILEDGENIFHCRATYSDGYIDNHFPVYWTCWRRESKVEPFSVFGDRRKPSVTIIRSKSHEKYSELACWLFKPSSRGEIPGNKYSSITFDYKDDCTIETFCQNCGKKINNSEKECQICGSKCKNTMIHLKDEFTLHDKSRIKAQKKVNGKNKLVYEETIGDDYHRINQKWNSLHRIIDHINDNYQELIKFGKTKLIIKKTDEKLSEHQGYGSARNKEK